MKGFDPFAIVSAQVDVLADKYRAQNKLVSFKPHPHHWHEWINPLWWWNAKRNCRLLTLFVNARIGEKK